MTEDRILAFVLAGGEGTQLHPLTGVRSKPTVPFSARYLDRAASRRVVAAPR
jgi:glucose-1-phosphate adenylyltransferase